MSDTKAKKVLMFPVKGVPKVFLEKVRNTLDGLNEGDDVSYQHEQREHPGTIEARTTTSPVLNKLSQEELKLMLLLWTKVSDRPVTQMEIETLMQENGIKIQTSLEAYLQHLVSLGYLKWMKDIYKYQIDISYEQYAKFLVSVSFARWGCNTILDYVAMLYNAEMISKDDIEDLYLYCKAIRDKGD